MPKTWKTLRMRVVSVKDADTLIADYKGLEVEIRFAGIDGIEKEQPFGQEAKTNLEKLFEKSKAISVTYRSKDQYNRLIGLIYQRKKLVNQLQLETGFAYPYLLANIESDLRVKFQQSFEEAKLKKINVHSLENPELPSDYRKKQREN
jgi:endonuclease YncB( thermonuclease family)